MTKPANGKSEELSQNDSAISETGHNPKPKESATNTHETMSRTTGTPDHAALVELVRRNFPEIYERTEPGATNGKPNSTEAKP